MEDYYYKYKKYKHKYLQRAGEYKDMHDTINLNYDSESEDDIRVIIEPYTDNAENDSPSLFDDLDNFIAEFGVDNIRNNNQVITYLMNIITNRIYELQQMQLNNHPNREELENELEDMKHLVRMLD